MATIKEIKNRIKGVRDTQKIANAMYLIASTKLRKAKNELEKIRPYFDALESLNNDLGRIFASSEKLNSRYFYDEKNEKASGERNGSYGALVITADKGLAGSYNHSVIKEAQRLLSEQPDTKLFVVGDYGRRFFSQRRVPIERSFLYTAQNPTMNRAREINEVLLEAFNNGEMDKIYVIYTDLKSGLNTQVVTTRLLPFNCHQANPLQEEELLTSFEMYPSIESVLESVVQSYLSGFIYSTLVAGFCSEQSARMSAMNSANQNAEKILELLTLQYNQVRQGAITQEITEISSGARAQKTKNTKEVSQN